MPPGLIRSLVEWVPRSVDSVSVLSGPLVLLGYLAGSIPFAYLLSRRRLRRQLARDAPPPSRPPGRVPTDGRGVVGAGALAAVATLLAATVAWDIALAAAPRGEIGAIGTFSNQAVGAWVSVALWTGMGAVVGNVAPVWSGFRGASGVAPAVALTAVYAPVVLAACALVWLPAYLVTSSARTALLCALPVGVTAAYLAWITDVQTQWGVTNGPELTLWVAVLAGVLGARNLRAPAVRGAGAEG